MERRRAAAALLALAACIACCTAAPTASNPTALELHDGPTEGCYYNFQHYGEGDRIMTNEPCLNCTCHNRMLMCYLRVCPFTKAIGQDCTVEKRADQCCPIVTCPDVPVDLLTSTSTSSPAEYGPTGVGKLDKYGCSINNKYFPEGSKVPSSPNKPCEHCYCIRNMTTCVMQECTLHVDGCTPIYHKDVCCPVRYSCDHSEDEIPLLDDMTTTVRPTQGFLLTTTTMMPVTQMTQDCIHDEQIFPDGASIKTDKACEHCYCMKGDIVCVVQECGTPMENEGKNCTSLPPRQGQCCPDTYICEGDEPSVDLTTETIDLTSVPPRRLGVEGSGYRNEPDEPITEKSPFEHDIEGSGDVSETDIPTKVSPTIKDELLLITTEKESVYSQTTEADKNLNTIIDQDLEKEHITFEEDTFIQPTESILMTSTESKVTMADEIVTSESVTSKHEDDIIDTENPLHSYERDEVLPTDISVEKESSSALPEQSTKMDEHSEYGVTETIIPIQKETDNILVSTDSVAPYDVTTTEHPIILSVTEKDSNEETSEINKIDISSKTTDADLTVTEQNKPDFEYSTVKELHIVDDATTVSSNKDGPETTSINPVDNEVDNTSGRIPGEGDCLVNGVRYSDNASVPSTNNCHTGCKCISSIVKCDPIICSPPPEYMENMNDCQTSYDSPDACCPTFVCSAKETSLPQSHSQTSVTESSKPVAPEECNSNDCGGVKQPSIEPHTICNSDNCDSEQKQNECGINGCQSEEQPPLEHPVICSGDKCSASPIGSCDGGNCEMVPTEEKNVDDKTHSVLPSKPICNDDGGCDNINDISPTQDECKDETCRRKDTFETDTNIQPECSGTQCKIDNQQNIPLIEPTIAPVTEYILNEINTEPNSDEAQKTASPLPNIIIPEKAITTESTLDITGYDYGTPSAPVKEQLPEKTLTNIITTEEPTKLITESAITGDSVTKIDNIENKVTVITENPQQEIIKSETSPMSESATEIIKTSDEASTEQGSYTRAPGQDETEVFTESNLVDYSSENKDTSSQEYTKEVSQTTTQKSETLLDIYETKSDESFTKLPVITDTEREINTMQIPDLSANEMDVTGKSEDYPLTTEKLEAISVNDEKISTTLQPTKIQDNEQTELPESAIEIQGGNEDHSELIPTEPQDIITEIIQTGDADDFNKFTTVKSITLPEVSENVTPMQTEIPSKLLETGSSESTMPIETISTEIDKTYTELPQTIGTKSDITIKLDESDNLFKESTTASSDVKVPEEFSTKLDEVISGGGHSKPETEKQENVTTETKPSTLNDNELNFVTERQTTVSQIKYTDNNYIKQEIQTKQPIIDTITEKTELQMTESHKESDIGDNIDNDSQTVSTFVDNVTEPELHQDITVTESAQQYTSYEGPAGEPTSKNPNLDLQTSTSSQDIFETKDTSTTAILRDEGDVEIMSSTDKNEIKVTSSSDDSVTETKYHVDVTEGEELTTLLPIEKIEQHYPTKELKLTTAYLNIPIETTTSVSISEEKQQTPDLEIPEKTMGDDNDRVKDITTESPSFTKDLSDEEILPVKIPELISHAEETTVIPNDNEKATISIYNTKEEITENSFDETTIGNIHISETVTENINMQPQDYPTQESSADESSKKPEVNENDIIKESPHSQTGSMDFDEYTTSAPDKYEAGQTPTLSETEMNNDEKPISTSVTLLTEDNEILTEKIPTSATAEKDSTTEKSENDIILDKHEQPNEPVVTSTESNTEQDIFQNIVTEDKQIGIVEKVTEMSPTAYESEMQNIGSSTSVQENEKPSSDIPKQTTEMQFESELTTRQEHQTVASIPKDQSSSELPFEGMPTLNQEDVGTTEGVPKQEDLPMHSEMPIDNIYTTNDLMTTNIVPIMHDELPKHPDIPSIDTVIPEHDRMGGEEDISKIEATTSSTESFITSQPSLITLPEASKTDTTKLTDMLEEQPIPSKMPESVVGSTSQTEIERVTKQEEVESYTTEKQYVSKSDQEEIPKITELPEEHITVQTETEKVNDQKDLGTLTTEMQHVTKSDQEDIPKIPVVIDEQNTPQSDIESATKLDVTVPYTTEKQYVTESNKEIPEISIVTEEQITDKTHTKVGNKEEDSELFTTERPYVTKIDQEIPKLPEQIEEQSTSRTDTESVTKLDDTESLVTEKQYVTNSDKEEEPKITVLIDEESTPQSVTELITKLNGVELYTTEKQYVTKSDEVEVPKIPEPSEEQTTDRADTEIVSKQGDAGSITTESQYVTKSDQEDIPKIPVLLDEQSTSQSDIESVTKLDDTEPLVTEKQYVTNSDQEESSKIPERVDEESSKTPETVNEESTSQNDMKNITELNDMESFTTEKQQVTKSNEEVPETPAQTTDQTDIEFVSKVEVAGPFTTESTHVTKLEEDISITPEDIADQSTSRYDSESVTKLDDTEASVTEKQYVSNSDQEATPKFPILSEEQSTSRIDTESVTMLEDSGTGHEETSSHKLDVDVSKPEQDSTNAENINEEPVSYPDTTVKSETEGSELFKPSEDVTVGPQKEDSPEMITTVRPSIPQKDETPIETDTENIDDFEKYSTERNVQTNAPVETVTLEEVMDSKPHEIEHKTPSKSSTEDQGIYSETTPYSVLLEEHTHPGLEDISSIIPIEEDSTTVKNEVQPERVGQIPDIPETNDEYEHTTPKQIEEERTTPYEKISSPNVHISDDTETTATIDKITSDTVIQDKDKKYSPSVQDEGLTTPTVLSIIKDKEQHITSPTMLEKEITTLADIITSSMKPEFISSSSKDTPELSSSGTSILQEESTTHLPASEDKYKEKPLFSSPSPSSSEMPDILGESHEDEHLPDFPPSGGGAGYGQEPDYVEEDQSFGPGTCRYGGKVYVSAQQIPRDDPCDFCFCFRSDIICLQQSCPPPIHGCHEEPIQGFCCPRYECPVSMATTMNVTTTTTTTTTTLPPHFLPHAYKGAAQRRGCQIKGHSYKVGEVVRASSGPCLHCTCGGDGQMKCDPKACTPEPMLRQMIAAAVSAKRRR